MDKPKEVGFKHIIGGAMVVLFGLIVYALIFREIPDGNREVFVHMLGIIEGVVVTIIGYYYGSSSGSKAKSETIEEELDKP
jgi:hypothetical protein